MVKLQKRSREGAADMYSLNIPIEVIETLKWKKGDEIILSAQKIKGQHVMFVIKQEDAIEVKRFIHG